ncbi:MAG: Calx-beta domain-containing protein, partial [Chthoniobacteraceae bacterium]
MLIPPKSSQKTRKLLSHILTAVVPAALGSSVPAFAAAPANDHFAEAEAITHATGSVIGTTFDATRQPDEPLANSTVWYRWTASFTGAVRFATVANDSSLVVAAYQGDALPTLDALAQKATGGNSQAAIEFNVIEGRVYRIQVGEFDGLDTPSGPFTLNWSRATGPGNFRLRSAFPCVPENAGNVTFTVERVPATGPVSVRYSFLDRMGRNGRDFVGVDGTLQFANGETTQSFTVQILDNAVVDSLESFIVKLDQPTGGSSLGFPSFSHVVIEDDDYPPNNNFAAATALTGSVGSVSGSLAKATVEEGEPPGANGSAPQATLWYSFTPSTSGIFTCRLDENSDGGLRVDAFAGTTLSTLAPVANARQMVDGTLVVPVSAGTDYLVRVDNPSSRTNDFTLNYLLVPGASFFEIADLGHLNEIRENGGARTVTVNRFGFLDSPASVRIVTLGRGNAIAGVDFVPVDTLLNFGPHESSQSIAITALADIALEGNERVRVQLSEPTGGAELIPDFGESIIINDQQDDPLNDDFANAFALSTDTTQLTSSNAGASREPGEPIHIFPRNHSVWFNYTAPKDGIATVSAHNEKFSALLAVYAGAAVDALSPIGEDTDDSDENPAVVRFRCSAGTVYRIAVDDRDDRNDMLFDDSEDSDDGDDGQGGGGGPFLLTYDTVAPGTLGFTLSNYVVSEGGGHALITLTRTSGSDGQVSIRYATANGTATAGLDYTAIAGEAIFAPGETSALVSVPIVDNALFDGPRTVRLILSDPVGDAD